MCHPYDEERPHAATTRALLVTGAAALLAGCGGSTPDAGAAIGGPPPAAPETSAGYLDDQELGLVPVSGPDGSPFFLYEGGGDSAVNGYECADDHDGRSLGLVGVTAREDLPAGEGPRYSGTYSAYSVADGIVAPVQSTPIDDVAAGDPALQTDPASCAPVV